PRTESARVALDSLYISNPGFAGVEPRRPASPSLAEQVPALVQRDLEPSEPITVGVGHLPVRLTLEQLLFLALKFVDSAEDLRVVHGASLSSIIGTARAPTPLRSRAPSIRRRRRRSSRAIRWRSRPRTRSTCHPDQRRPRTDGIRDHQVARVPCLRIP